MHEFIQYLFDVSDLFSSAFGRNDVLMTTELCYTAVRIILYISRLLECAVLDVCTHSFMYSCIHMSVLEEGGKAGFVTRTAYIRMC